MDIGSGWINAGEVSWSYTELDTYITKELSVISTLDTILKINACRLKLVWSGGVPAECVPRLTYVYLNVKGTVKNDVLRYIVAEDNLSSIVPNYVNKVSFDLDNIFSSGYNINTDYVVEDLTEFTYLNFPFVPANDCIREINGYLTAKKSLLPTPLPSLHWIVTPAKQLCIASIGNHNQTGNEGYTISDVWPTYANAGTIEVRDKMLVNDFVTADPTANYVIMAGNYEWPTGEYYTEGHAIDWDAAFSGTSYGGIENSSTLPSEIAYRSLYSTKMRIATNIGAEKALFWFPKTFDMAVDVTRIGTEKQIPHLSFWGRKDNDFYHLRVCLYRDESNYFWMDLNQFLPNNDQFHFVQIQIGPYYRKENDSIKWEETGSPDWHYINRIGFYLYPGTATTPYYRSLLVDDLKLTGSFIRVSYHSTNITTYGCRQMLIKDVLAKADDLNPDSENAFAMIGLFELRKGISTPTTGRIVIEMDERLMAGQIIHIHSSKKEDGSFLIDRNFRITEVTHSFTLSGATTMISLNDDLFNSSVNDPNDLYKTIILAVNPDFQTRDLGSFKGADIDIDSYIIFKNYA